MAQGTRPISGWTRSLGKSMDQFDREDMSDEFRKKEQKLDALTEKLKATCYFHKMRWPWFFINKYGINQPLAVDRYYHEVKIAIDFGKVHEEYSSAKLKLLTENGIKYILLNDANDLKSLVLGLS
jgi:hypothetical protein